VVIHEAFGLTDDIRGQADRLAGTGLLAYAPDLFDGRSGLRCVLRAFRDLSAGHGRGFDILESARAQLATHPDCTGRVGVIGFCLGGGFALAAAAKSDYAAASVNYGLVPKNTTEALRGVCPVVASYGGRDRGLPRAAARLESALTELGVPHDVREYPEAKHGFMGTHRPPLILRVLAQTGFHGPSAQDAFGRIDAFFAQHLADA
jgi:carboxymethylenebutenolidase